MADKMNINIRPVNSLQIALHNSNTARLEIQTPTAYITDYNSLRNLPTINRVELKGDLTYIDLSLAKQNINTREYWNNLMTYIPSFGEIIIYTNRSTIDGVDYPGLKIGDGLAYVVDLPFVGDDMYNNLITFLTEHVNDRNMHVTMAEKEFWNNKLNCEMDNETLIFNKL